MNPYHNPRDLRAEGSSVCSCGHPVFLKRMPVWGQIEQHVQVIDGRTVVIEDVKPLKSKEPGTMRCVACGLVHKNPDFVKQGRDTRAGDEPETPEFE